jgi:hypothetical protein
MSKKKYSLSLVEVFVALFLFTLLIPPIVSCFQAFAKQEKVLVKKKNELQELSLCHAKLQKIFLSLKSQTPFKPALFFSEKDSLVVSYDNGVDTPAFSNVILGKIFKEGNTLVCANFPYPIDPPKKEVEMRKDKLLSDVSSFWMEFWTVDPVGGVHTGEPKEFVWHKIWEKKYEKVPILVKMHLTRAGKEHTFFFVLPNSIRTIQYEG